MSTPLQNWYKEYRCTACKKLLCKGVLVESEVEIKCKHCGTLCTFYGVPMNDLLCLIPQCPHRVKVETNKPAT